MAAMSDARDEMAQIRAALDKADTALVAALDARARAVRGFVALRDRDPGGYHVLPSAADVVAHATELRKDFPPAGLEPVLREVLSACAEMIGPVEVVVPEPEGGFAHLAARRWFGARAEVRTVDTIPDVFAEIERSRSVHAVVPFETSTEGALAATVRALVDTSAKVVGEKTIAVARHLYSRTGNAGDVEKIYGAGSTLAACERTLRQRFPGATVLDVRSGVIAAQLALEDHGAAAVGSELLAEIGTTLRPQGVSGELRPVDKHVDDVTGSVVRFLVLGRLEPRRTGSDRTMLVLGLGEGPGSLYAALQPFAERGINLTRLESRPGHGAAWDFFVELDGHVSDRPVLTAIDEVKARARHVKVLGSYPRPER